MKKISILLCIILIITAMPVNIEAQRVNSIATVTVKNENELKNTIYKELMAHKTNFKIICKYEINKNKQSYIDNIVEDVYAIDKKSSSDNDYLRYSIYGYQWNSRQNAYTKVMTYQFKITYHETSNQLKQVNTKVKDIIHSLNLGNAMDYQKIKLIHNYLVKHITYDQSYSNYSAYTALLKKTAVCQGYSLSMYKLLTVAGIPCRVISGKGNGSAHAWNIVKLDGKWYNLDVTWDDAIGAKKILYTYFLKGTNNFYKDHKPDMEYKSKTFLKTYPINSRDYAK